MHNQDNPLENVKEILEVSAEDLAKIFQEYFSTKHQLLDESIQSTRYAVNVDYRTTMDEIKFGFAKIALGYVSAALKKLGFHIKLVFTEKPLRIIVSSRNWDDNEWVGMISYNSTLGAFILSKGYYNRSKKTVTVMRSTTIDGSVNASNMAEKLKSTMDSLEHEPIRKTPKIEINLKRGPKS
jgi:hypothetical protein